MNINKFEEKTVEFLNETYPTLDKTNNFELDIVSLYKEKRLTFTMMKGLDSIAFKCVAESYDELFDKAYKILKSYAPKSTRERNKETEPDESNNTTNPNEI